ncbi:MAG: hypothetical protein D6820_13650 [Lentisphaerae bacterium]|nr:MAG: hypothetical protein D6820_13650 [Lentisphaerota bacterium]
MSGRLALCPSQKIRLTLTVLILLICGIFIVGCYSSQESPKIGAARTTIRGPEGKHFSDHKESATHSQDIQQLVTKLRQSPMDTQRVGYPPLPKFPIKERDWGKEFHDRHPVLRHPANEKMARYGEAILKKFTIAKLKAMVPKQVPGNLYTQCPICQRNHVPFKWQNLNRDQWLWNPQKPNQITCKGCGTTYPNQRYPMNHERIYLNPFGEKIRISFYKDPENGNEFFLGAVLDTCKDAFLRSALMKLAYAYNEKGDEKAGEAAVAILDGYARSIPHWLTYGAHHWGAPLKQRGYLSTGGPFLRNGKYAPYDMGNGPYPYA